MGGSFHELKVRVAVVGAQVRARTGYYPFPDSPLATPRNDRALTAKLAMLFGQIGLFNLSRAVSDPNLSREILKRTRDELMRLNSCA